MSNEHMNVVFVGHVDHGKSTIIGRLLAETNTLPHGKLETIKRYCELNAKPFEYAFLLDALGDEQAQGITIDIARCFLKTQKRHYLILDAPGHIEFLKNLVTGAANAEAAFLIIDAKEGIQENTRRHAYMLSLLQVKQVVVLINKVDLIHYDEAQYHHIQQTFSDYLKQLKIQPIAYIPISGQKGDNITMLSHSMPWYQGPTVLETLDKFNKQLSSDQHAFRMQVQDVYKFTNNGDSRRIVVGQVNSGRLTVGSQVIFSPSGKTSRVKSIEGFNTPSHSSISAGYSTGFTLCEQIYVKRGDVVFLANDPPVQIASTLVVSLFWLGRNPLRQNKEYWFKLGPSKVKMTVQKITHVIDTATLFLNDNADAVLANQAAECTIQLFEPIAYDKLAHDSLNRFVIVDAYDIAGGGTILSHIDDDKTKQQAHLYQRNLNWTSSGISSEERELSYRQPAQLILISGDGAPLLRKTLALAIERFLFSQGRYVYFAGIGNVKHAFETNMGLISDNANDNFLRFCEVLNILLDTGLIIIATAAEISTDNIEQIKRRTEHDNMIPFWLSHNNTQLDPHFIPLDATLPIEQLLCQVQSHLQIHRNT